MTKFRFGLKYRYAALAAGLLLLFGTKGFRSLVSNYREYRRLCAEKGRLELQRDELKRQLADVRGNPAVEQAARLELSMIRPGETEYRFPPPKDSDR